MKRILLDENIPLELTAFSPKGCDVPHVLGEDWKRMPDDALLTHAEAAGIDVAEAAEPWPPTSQRYVLSMRLSAFPYVVVRVACTRCPRRGAYRLADRYGAEMTLPYLIEALAADCKLREGRRPNIYDRCGAYFPDVGGTRPPDEPVAAKPTLRVVKS